MEVYSISVLINLPRGPGLCLLASFGCGWSDRTPKLSLHLPNQLQFVPLMHSDLCLDDSFFHQHYPCLPRHASPLTSFSFPGSRNVQWELPMTDLRKVSISRRISSSTNDILPNLLYCLAHSSHLFHSIQHPTGRARQTRSHRGRPKSS